MPRELTVKMTRLQSSAGRASTLLKALSNRSRLLILCELVGGERTVGDLQRHVGLSQSGLSQHLAVLRREGIVATRREAQSIYYSLDSEEAVAVMGTLCTVCCAPSRAKPRPRRRQPRREVAALPRGRTA